MRGCILWHEVHVSVNRYLKYELRAGRIVRGAGSLDNSQSTESMTMEKGENMVKNTASKRGFFKPETALMIVGWIAFVIGVYAVSDPMWELIILAISRVLP